MSSKLQQKQDEIDALKKRLAELESEIDPTVLIKIGGKPMKIKDQRKIYEGRYGYENGKQYWISPINIIEVTE